MCDLVAGRLLVPNSTLDDVLGGERPTGQALARLHDGSNASREACAVALCAAWDVRASSRLSEMTL